MGVSGDKFKVGNINEFDSNDVIVPVRSKNLEVDSVVYDKNIKISSTRSDYKEKRKTFNKELEIL